MAITQQWITVWGLMLDFAGFAVLLREWWLAFFNEGRQLEMDEQLEGMRSMRNLRPRAPGERNPFESLERAQDEQALRKARHAHRAAMSARKATFLCATGLIVVGFLLQVVGAWPGCCAPWVTPQG